MMVDKVIEPDSLKATPAGFSLGLRLPWYRSVPLSTVELVSVKVDGRPIPADRMRIALNGGEWGLDALPDLTDQFWFVIDTAQLNVANEPLDRSAEHDVEVVLAVFPPYIKGLRRLLRWTRRMRVH